MTGSFGLVACLFAQAIDSNKRGSFGSLQAPQLFLDALSEGLFSARILFEQRVRVFVPHGFVRSDQLPKRKRRRFDKERDERVDHLSLVDSLRGSQQKADRFDAVRFGLIASQPIHNPIEQIIVQIPLGRISHETLESNFDAFSE